MNTTDIINTGKKVLNCECAALTVLCNELGADFALAVLKITEIKGRVIVSGMGKSGHIGQKIAATLASTGTPAFFVHPGEASHGDLGMLTKDDLLLLISNSGETKEMNDIISFAKRFGIPMIGITSNKESTVAKTADIALIIPSGQKAPEACILGVAPTTSTTLTLALGDALAVALMQQHGFTLEDFHLRHPGGKLGNVLVKVSDIMAKENEVPLVDTEMMMSEALLIMTEKSWGCLGVVDSLGHLVGIITDGDLRRHMSADLIVRKTGDIMTKNPKTIKPLLLAVEAVRILNTNKITNIFVVDDDNKPVGLLHIHQCLQVGVV